MNSPSSTPLTRATDSRGQLRRRPSRLQRAIADIPASAGALVMGTGIVSVGLHLDKETAPADVLLALAAAAWVALGLLAAYRVAADPERFLAGARSPAALTAVAATAVLGVGAQDLGWTAVAASLLTVAFCIWLALIRRVSWSTSGVTFMLVVAPQGISALGADLARSDWLLVAAGVLTGLGIALYPAVARRFDLKTLRTGAGAQWVAGGSLAISALAAAELALGVRGLEGPGGLYDALRVVAVVVWAAAVLWIPVLVVSELVWPRWRYRGERWSTVFPLGMYAVCSFAVSGAEHSAPIRDFGRVWLWVAVAAWVATVVGMVVDFSASRSSDGGAFPSKED